MTFKNFRRLEVALVFPRVTVSDKATAITQKASFSCIPLPTPPPPVDFTVINWGGGLQSTTSLTSHDLFRLGSEKSAVLPQLRLSCDDSCRVLPEIIEGAGLMICRAARELMRCFSFTFWELSRRPSVGTVGGPRRELQLDPGPLVRAVKAAKTQQAARVPDRRSRGSLEPSQVLVVSRLEM